jgi:hypothetical protein
MWGGPVTRSESLNRSSLRVSSITRAFDLPSWRIEWAWKGTRLSKECAVLRQKELTKITPRPLDQLGACGGDDDDGHEGTGRIGVLTDALSHWRV